MDFIQELVFTSFLAFIFSFVIGKFVSLAFSNSDDDDDGKTAIFSVEEVNLGSGLKVGSTKSKKRVKSADDVMVRKIDQYQGEKGFENIGLCLDESVGEVIVEEESKSEKMAKMMPKIIDQFEGEELKNDSEIKISGVVQDTVDEDKGSENIGKLIEKTNEGNEIGDICGEKEDTVIFREKKNGEELESHEIEIDQKEGNGNGGEGENEELIKGDVEEEKVRDESADDEDEDDWEGIERSDLEKVFAEAVNYVEYGAKGKEKLLSNVQMQLYGLHMVAVEGPCHEPQPMALKVSSRAKWNAWQRLGSMNQEAAMEQYIKILSDCVPEWMKYYNADDDLQGSASGTPSNSDSQLRSLPKDERKEELNIVTDVGDSGLEANSVDKDKNEKIRVTA